MSAVDELKEQPRYDHQSFDAAARAVRALPTFIEHRGGRSFRRQSCQSCTYGYVTRGDAWLVCDACGGRGAWGPFTDEGEAPAACADGLCFTCSGAEPPLTTEAVVANGHGLRGVR